MNEKEKAELKRKFDQLPASEQEKLVTSVLRDALAKDTAERVRNGSLISLGNDTFIKAEAADKIVAQMLDE